MTEITITRDGTPIKTFASSVAAADLSSLSIMHLEPFFREDEKLDVDHTELWLETSLLDSPAPQTLTAYVDVLTVGASKPIRYVIHLNEMVNQ